MKWHIVAVVVVLSILPALVVAQDQQSEDKPPIELPEDEWPEEEPAPLTPEEDHAAEEPAAVSEFDLWPDVLHLKDGTTIRGRIVEETPGIDITFKIPEGGIFVYSRDDVLRVSRARPPRRLQRKSPGEALTWSL